MKIELKGIKHARSLSEETNAFTANVYIEGKRVAVASNRGHGEMVEVRPLQGERNLVTSAERFLAKQNKVVLSSDLSVTPDLELVIGRMIEVDLIRRDVQKRGKKLFGPNTRMAILHRDTKEIYVYKVGPETWVSDAKGKAHEVFVERQKQNGHDAVCLNILFSQSPDDAYRELATAWEVDSDYDWTLESMLTSGVY